MSTMPMEHRFTFGRGPRVRGVSNLGRGLSTPVPRNASSAFAAEVANAPQGDTDSGGGVVTEGTLPPGLPTGVTAPSGAGGISGLISKITGNKKNLVIAIVAVVIVLAVLYFFVFKKKGRGGGGRRRRRRRSRR